MTNARRSLVEPGGEPINRWLDPAAFGAVRLLPANKNLPFVVTLTRRSRRRRRSIQWVGIVLAGAATSVGGFAAVRASHAGAVNTPTSVTLVRVDVTSNPDSPSNKAIGALTVSGALTVNDSTHAETRTGGALPALGAQEPNN